MAVATMRVPTVFTAVDRFSNVVSKMTSGVTNFSNSTASAISRVDHRMNGMFRSMNNFSQLALGGGASLLFYNAGRDIMEYETKIASLAAVTGTKVGAMNKQIESLGKSTGRSVIDIAGAFEIVGSKMSEYLKNPEALKKITDGSILLANAARMELEPAIESVTQLLNIYQMKAGDTARIVNKLSAGETVGSISIAQSGDILRQFGAQAVSTNAKLEESIALIQTLTKPLGVKGVGRNLRNILFDISSTKTWDKNRWKAIKMAGVDFEFVTNKANNLTDRLRELKKLSETKGATELFFKKTGTVGAKTLFQNFETYENFLDKINKLDDAEAKAIKNTGTFSYKIGRLKDSFTNFMVTGQETNATLDVVKKLIVVITKNMGLLINSVGLVIGAFLAFKAVVFTITAVTKAITFLTAVTKAYHLTSLAAAISGQSFIGVLSSGTAPLMAYAGTIGALGLALGGLYYYWTEFGEATYSYTAVQEARFERISESMSNTTKVMKRELEAQKLLLESQFPDIKNLQGKELEKAMIKTEEILGKIVSLEEKYKKDVISDAMGTLRLPTGIYSNTPGFSNGFGVTATAPLTNFDKARNLTREQLIRERLTRPENLSGRMQPSYNDVLKLIQSQDKEIKITTIDPSGIIGSVETFGFGTPAKTTSTTGQATGR